MYKRVNSINGVVLVLALTSSLCGMEAGEPFVAPGKQTVEFSWEQHQGDDGCDIIIKNERNEVLQRIRTLPDLAGYLADGKLPAYRAQNGKTLYHWLVEALYKCENGEAASRFFACYLLQFLALGECRWKDDRGAEQRWRPDQADHFIQCNFPHYHSFFSATSKNAPQLFKTEHETLVDDQGCLPHQLLTPNQQIAFFRYVKDVCGGSIPAHLVATVPAILTLSAGGKGQNQVVFPDGSDLHKKCQKLQAVTGSSYECGGQVGCALLLAQALNGNKVVEVGLLHTPFVSDNLVLPNNISDALISFIPVCNPADFAQNKFQKAPWNMPLLGGIGAGCVVVAGLIAWAASGESEQSNTTNEQKISVDPDAQQNDEQQIAEDEQEEKLAREDDVQIKAQVYDA